MEDLKHSTKEVKHGNQLKRNETIITNVVYNCNSENVQQKMSNLVNFQFCCLHATFMNIFVILIFFQMNGVIYLFLFNGIIPCNSLLFKHKWSHFHSLLMVCIPVEYGSVISIHSLWHHCSDLPMVCVIVGFWHSNTQAAYSVQSQRSWRSPS